MNFDETKTLEDTEFPLSVEHELIAAVDNIQEYLGKGRNAAGNPCFMFAALTAIGEAKGYFFGWHDDPQTEERNLSSWDAILQFEHAIKDFAHGEWIKLRQQQSTC